VSRGWVLGVALLAAACTVPPPQACSPPLKPALQVSLYFGRDSPHGEVSEAEWARFLAEEVTPRFPAGLSVVEVAGQYTEPGGRLVREKTKLVVVVVFDAPAHLPRVQAVVDAFSRRHGQHSVFRTEHAVCAGG
jgi:Protein of unknown function (DUF3574)